MKQHPSVDDEVSVAVSSVAVVEEDVDVDVIVALNGGIDNDRVHPHHHRDSIHNNNNNITNTVESTNEEPKGLNGITSSNVMIPSQQNTSHNGIDDSTAGSNIICINNPVGTTDNSNNNSIIPVTFSRTNRAPPTIAFFLRTSWKNRKRKWNRNHQNSYDDNNDDDMDDHPNIDNDERDESTHQQQQHVFVSLHNAQRNEIGTSSYTAALTPEEQNDNDDDDNDHQTSSLLSSPPPQQQPLFSDRIRRVRFSNIRQILFDPETYEHIQRTIRRSGNYIAICTLFVMLILVPTVLYRSLIDRKLDIAAIHSARVMVVGTIIMSLRLVYLHLTHWFMPDVQKYVVRILWMVPIYAIQSYFSLRYHHARVYMSTIRDFYEAFVITSFVYYLMELLGGQDSLIHILQQKNPRYGYHKFPISLVLQPWVVGEEFLLQCKHGVLQYVVFKTTATIVIFLCEYCGVYGEGHFEWFVAYPYLCFFQNISVMYALYCLVIFFHACNEELHHPVNWHPLGKFLCIKGVVFFTWWQGVIIFYLKDHGIIGSMGPWSSIDVANGFIDYCIVVEMVGFAIAHSYTFTYTEYLPGRFEPISNTDRNQSSQALLSTDDESCPIPHQQQQQNNNNMNNDRPVQHYRPPATLPEPMRFRDALWSSTVPHETLHDIQRLRAGVVDSVMNQPTPMRAISRGISLLAMNTSVSHGVEENVAIGGRHSSDPELEHPLPDAETEAEVSFI